MSRRKKFLHVGLPIIAGIIAFLIGLFVIFRVPTLDHSRPVAWAYYLSGFLGLTIMMLGASISAVVYVSHEDKFNPK